MSTMKLSGPMLVLLQSLATAPRHTLSGGRLSIARALRARGLATRVRVLRSGLSLCGNPLREEMWRLTVKGRYEAKRRAYKINWKAVDV